LPVVDQLAAEYADRVAFVAPAWKGTADATAERADELMTSGVIQWGLDVEEQVFAAYGVPYQPVTVLIGADDTIVDSWAGALAEDELRARIEALLEA
jgi:hypothetical protein